MQGEGVVDRLPAGIMFRPSAHQVETGSCSHTCLHQCQPPGEAPVHIVIGSAGASLDADTLYNKVGCMLWVRVQWGLPLWEVLQGEEKKESLTDDSYARIGRCSSTTIGAMVGSPSQTPLPCTGSTSAPSRLSAACLACIFWSLMATRDNRTVNDAWIYKAGVPEATVTTSSGCRCQQPWMNDDQSFYNCWNPDGDTKNWCYVQVRNDCAMP